MPDRYEYANEIEAFVDMKDATDEYGLELLTSDVLALLNEHEVFKKAHSDQLAETDYCYVCGEHTYAHNTISKCPIGA